MRSRVPRHRQDAQRRSEAAAIASFYADGPGADLIDADAEIESEKQKQVDAETPQKVPSK